MNRKNTGFTLIIILILSDFFFSLNLAYFQIAESYNDFVLSISVGLYFFALYFSVIWASAISILVYKALQTLNYESNKRIFKTALIVLVISGGLTA